ncbi:glucocorticoid modulatory element-binding protein 1-like isoform X1 [Conger conger]|uniref:glucocorticoid modulatory element-binding protein 1-like isoform X1 n=2 Tax=Conger conger TaxID=82655 RepID=UPI002A5AFE73|nr:glucocorticoid modulatory element-binding protein 1-like isoform X1 [Conger conger]
MLKKKPLRKSQGCVICHYKKKRDREVTGEMGTAIVAVETHNEDSAVEGEGIEYGYPITCGGSRAVLLFKKFVCPGINVRCVKYNDQLISPKQFVHLAGKATLKDWKRAIRLGGVMLRRMMDSGQIDFYQHDTVCTNTCRSTKFDLLISSSRLPHPGATLPAPRSPQGNGGPVALAEDQPEEAVATAADWTSSVATAIATAAQAEIQREAGEISSADTLAFWKAIADVGLMAEVVSNIRTELLALLRDIQLRSGEGALQEPDAAALSSLAQMFGLLDSVKRALENRRGQPEQNQEQHLYSLEEQKKPCDWPQHPLVLPSMHLPTPPAPKRPRLQRPAPSSALIGSYPLQRSTPAPVTLPSVGRPIGSRLRTSCCGPTHSEEHSRVRADEEEEEEDEEEEEEDDGIQYQENVQII